MILAVVSGSWLSLVIALAAVCRVASYGDRQTRRLHHLDGGRPGVAVRAAHERPSL